MKPVLFTIATFNVYSFGFFLMLSFIISTFFVYKIGKEELKETEYLDAYLYGSLTAILSARLFYIIFHFEEFGSNILRYIVVRETPGLSFIGAIIGTFFFLIYYCKRKKLDLLHLLDIFSLAFSSGMIFAKIGQQLGGSAFGKPTETFFAIRIIGQLNRRHPTELYESLLYLLLTVFLLFLFSKTQRKILRKGFVFYVFCLSSSIIIFLLEFFKEESVYLYGLTFHQFLAVILLMVIIYPFLKQVQVLVRK